MVLNDDERLPPGGRWVTDLYLMQNSHGMIKIGESIHPEKRRRNLENADQCDIQIVAIRENKGEREKPIHLRLDKYRALGEWFYGDDGAKRAVARAFPLKPETVWPFAYDEISADAWLDRLEAIRSDRFRRNLIQTLIRNCRRLEAPSRWIDCDICFVIERSGCDIGHDDNNATTYHYEKMVANGDSCREVLPCYTSNAADALSIWPEDLRPGSWDGSAVDCCIEGLLIHKSRIPKGARIWSRAAP